MSWDDLIRAANKVEARAKIQGSTHLDQRYPKGKWLLKISLNFRDNATDKKAPQAKNKAHPAKQISEAEKSSKKARKEKQKKGRQGRCEKPNPATGVNAVPATAGGNKGQKKKKKPRNISKITCYSCNKKGYYTSDCTELKN